MVRLAPGRYASARALLRGAETELSVAATLEGENPGEVLADRAESPRVVLIRTTETSVVAGDAECEQARERLRATLGFCEHVTPDTREWDERLPCLHPNPYLRRALKRQYTAAALTRADRPLPPGMTLERLERAHFELENGEAVRHWAEAWGTEHFFRDGAGFVVRRERTLAAWSLTDCRVGDHAAIGIVTDPRFRRMGLATAAAAATAAYWLSHGVRTLEWICYRANAGSRSVAEKLGFSLEAEYPIWLAVPAFENDTDLTREEWAGWDAHYRRLGAYAAHPEIYAPVERRIARILAQGGQETDENRGKGGRRR